MPTIDINLLYASLERIADTIRQYPIESLALVGVGVAVQMTVHVIALVKGE